MNSLRKELTAVMLLRLLGTYFWSNLYIRATLVSPLALLCTASRPLCRESDYSPEKNVLWCMAFRSSNPSSDHPQHWPVRVYRYLYLGALALHPPSLRLKGPHPTLSCLLFLFLFFVCLFLI